MIRMDKYTGQKGLICFVIAFSTGTPTSGLRKRDCVLYSSQDLMFSETLKLGKCNCVALDCTKVHINTVTNDF